ncbi:MAG TPA: aldo/keto reductase [Solirubrobacteraceae bacterium]|nr:aldo/keto reductase [Solirubrobacteraceae bacterium]
MPETMPPLGLGTWQLNGRDCVDAVEDAIRLGYRHIDTARAYGNEREVGEGLRRSGIPRDEVWITTKLWREGLRPEQVREQMEASLRELGSGHVDLLLIHWPNADVPLAETLGTMAELRDAGRARNLGVSNFPSDLVREAAAVEHIHANQVEYHAYLTQEKVLEACREHDVLVTAYSPFAHGEVLKDDVLLEIAEARGASPGEIALRWLLDQPGVTAVPKAASHEHRESNLRALEVDPLSDEERERIDALPKDRRVIDPGWAPRWDG